MLAIVSQQTVRRSHSNFTRIQDSAHKHRPSHTIIHFLIHFIPDVRRLLLNALYRSHCICRGILQPHETICIPVQPHSAASALWCDVCIITYCQLQKGMLGESRPGHRICPGATVSDDMSVGFVEFSEFSERTPILSLSLSMNRLRTCLCFYDSHCMALDSAVDFAPVVAFCVCISDMCVSCTLI